MPQQTPTGPVRSSVGEVRRQRGIAAADLARRVGVSRQTIHAIESGAYVPNTVVALRLAAELQTTVEGLFGLGEVEAAEAELAAEVLSPNPVTPGQGVRLCRVGERLIAVPATPQPAFLPQADGIVGRVRRGKTGVTVLAPQSREVERLVVAGCDPAIGLAVSLMERSAAVEVLPVAASSRLALEWLHSGKIHIAGAHLRDNASGEFNLPVLKREYPKDDLAVVTFAHWEAGLVCAPGNPKRLRGVEDLARRSVRFVNREAGSGSRALLDRLLAQSGVPASKVRGYDRVALGHLAAAHAVFTGSADVCLATRSAARAFALDFVPLERERYDLIVRREMLRHPGVSVFLDVLQRASLRRLLEHHAGYDVAATGSVLA